MENLNFESGPDDSEKPKDKDSPPPKRVSLPASALHSMGHEGAKLPKFEHIFDATQLHHDMLFQKSKETAPAEKKEDEEESDADSDTTPTVAPAPKAAEPTTELPLQHLAKELEAPAGQTPETTQLTPEEAAQFEQIVEVDLHDLRDLNLDKPSEKEPGNLNPPVAEAVAGGPVEGPIEGEVPLHAPTPPVESRAESPAAQAADFAAWEREMQTQDLPEFPAPAPAAATAAASRPFTPPPPSARASLSPNPNVPNWQPESAAYPGDQSPPPPGQPGSGGGGGRPPLPPIGPNLPGGGAGPNFNAAPLPQNANFQRPAFNPNILANPNLLNSAALLHLNAKLNYLDFKRRRGDAIVGTVAGWALLRTFKNRRMIRGNERTAQASRVEQAATNTRLEQQNTTLGQRLERIEQQPPTRGPEQTVAAAAALTPQESARKAEAEAAEKVRLIHEQHEKALRQQELEVPPDRHIDHSGWHSIEIDDRTGRAVEKPATFEYGKAFNEERQQEQLSDRAQNQLPHTGQDGAAGPPQPTMAQLPSVPGSLPGMPGAADQRQVIKKEGAMHSVAQTASDPWVWAGIIFLLIVFFVAAIL